MATIRIGSFRASSEVIFIVIELVRYFWTGDHQLLLRRNGCAWGRLYCLRLAETKITDFLHVLSRVGDEK